MALQGPGTQLLQFWPVSGSGRLSPTSGGSNHETRVDELARFGVVHTQIVLGGLLCDHQRNNRFDASALTQM
jgi:hypothetical protein